MTMKKNDELCDQPNSEIQELIIRQAFHDVLETDVQNAVELALSVPTSIICAEPNSEPIDVIRKLLDAAGEAGTVLCAPDIGLALQLRWQIGGVTYPVFGSPISKSSLIIITHAHALPPCTLDWALSRRRPGARLVLIGDDCQGTRANNNILKNLIDAGIPSCRLRGNPNGSALRYDLSHFSELRNTDDMYFDDSFEFLELSAEDAERQIISDATQLLRTMSVHVVTPVSDAPHRLYTNRINGEINRRVDPITGDATYASTVEDAMGWRFGTILVPLTADMAPIHRAVARLAFYNDPNDVCHTAPQLSCIPIFSIRSWRLLSCCACEMAPRSRNISNVFFCRRNSNLFFSS